MAVTPQTNTTLEAIAHEMSLRDNFVICGHVSPDGDCLGSQLALMRALRSMGKHAWCVLAGSRVDVDGALAYLPGFDELIPASEYDGPCDVFVGVDVPTIERIGEAAALHASAPFSITVDHHAVPTVMADLVYVDPAAAATALLVWELVGHLVGERDDKMALCAYTGLLTDTGCYQNQNTDAAAFKAAGEMVAAGVDPAFVACEAFQNRRLASIRLEAIAIEHMELIGDGQAALSWLSRSDFEKVDAIKADGEHLVSVLRSIRGVRLACVLREQDGAVRGSFRAKDDTDAGSLARYFGGGGHKAAAGFTLHTTLDEARSAVARAMAELVAQPVGTAYEGGSR